jgi:hypothetical protein
MPNAPSTAVAGRESEGLRALSFDLGNTSELACRVEGQKRGDIDA